MVWEALRVWWGGVGRQEGKGRGVNGSKFGVGMRLFGSPMNPFKNGTHHVQNVLLWRI